MAINVMFGTMLKALGLDFGFDDVKKMGSEQAEKLAKEVMTKNLMARKKMLTKRASVFPLTDDEWVGKDGKKWKSKEAAIREIMFNIWKIIWKHGYIADLWRDSHDDKIIALVSPRISSSTTHEELVLMVIKEEVELTF